MVADSPPVWRHEPGELWHVNSVLVPDAMEWFAGLEDGVQLAIMERRTPFDMVFSTPLTPTQTLTHRNPLVHWINHVRCERLDPNVPEEAAQIERHRWMLHDEEVGMSSSAGHHCAEDGWWLEPSPGDEELAHAVIASSAVGSIMREYAALPLPERPRTNINVAIPDVKGPTTPPTILIVQYRKHLDAPRDSEDGTIDVAWSHRWIVRAHLRRLPTGRLTAVREHVKGPVDLPLVYKHRINALTE
jgi:hypothetical protein